jgi:ligand-binding sensor domain-containing protein
VWSIMQDKKGTLWFGTRHGVYIFDGTSFSRFLDLPTIVNKDNLQLRMVDSMVEDQNGHIWFCSGMMPGGEGICRYDGQSLTRFKPDGNGWIRTVIANNNGDLCFATRHFGVCRYDIRCDALANVTTHENRIVPACFTNFTAEAGIDNSSVTTILEDKAGNIWIATELGSGELGEDGGVWCYDGKSFTRFTTKEGLVHNGVFTIVEDRAGNIWFGTRNTGLCRYDGKTFTSFSE